MTEHDYYEERFKLDVKLSKLKELESKVSTALSVVILIILLGFLAASVISTFNNTMG